ncbi:Glutathione synthetase [Holothuria leucospilota]|uniref:Glutathione synthetase n=1 Tax=Holothuria leucospilota TaxID=206669 RepID=A0A9Q1HCL4_HOLLE|nr:Glutathione synthetase [Holothuria leucospilota]
MTSLKSKELPGCVPLPIPSPQLQVLSEEAKYFACVNGFFLKMDDNSNLEAAVPGPFTLLPSPVPRHLYEKAVVNQRYINELYFKVANDYDFLWKTLKSAIAVDDFTAKQWAIFEEARKARKHKDIQLALIRADYQLDTSRGKELKLSQFEVNTIAVAMAGISSRLRKVHNVILQKLGRFRDVSRLAENNASTDFAKTLIAAWKLFNNPEAAIVMLSHEDEVNVFDHKILEQAIYELQPGLTFVRTTMTEMGKRATLTENDTLMMDDKEVAVVYYRTGYMPKHYTTDHAWKAKLMAELSNAAVCPSVGWHLAGTKKVQQELNRPGVLEKYISDPQVISEIRETCTGMYSLDQTSEGDAAAARGIAEPEKYVMKPQLEGGCK